MRHVAKVGVLVAVAIWASAHVTPAWATVNGSDEDTIEYRQNIMKSKDSQAAAIGQILALMVPDQNLPAHFEALLLATRQAKLAFKQRVVGGGSLPAVWDNWKDFSERLDRAEEVLTKAVAAAREHGGAGGIGEDAIEAMNTCKSCHDIYRKK